MSCPHATTTTLLWLYGEADESHAEHVAGCAVCRAVVAEHADVMSAMAEVSHLDLRPSNEASTLPRPAHRPMWHLALGAVVGGAMAAAVALTVRPAPTEQPPVERPTIVLGGDDGLDDRFDALAWELGDLQADVEGGVL